MFVFAHLFFSILLFFYFLLKCSVTISSFIIVIFPFFLILTLFTIEMTPSQKVIFFRIHGFLIMFNNLNVFNYKYIKYIINIYGNTNQ